MTAPDSHPDFAKWAQTWQDDTHTPAAAELIRDYVRRRGRLLRLLRFIDVAVGVVALPVVAYLAWVADSDVERMSMIGLASIVIAAAAFGWWNWSAALSAAASTTTDYVAVSAGHLRRMRLAWLLGWAVLAAEVVVFIIWIRNRLYATGGPVDPDVERFAWLWLTGFTMVAAVSLLWFGRWLSRDAARFERLRRELESEPSIN
jgi:hypothetical protein